MTGLRHLNTLCWQPVIEWLSCTINQQIVFHVLVRHIIIYEKRTAQELAILSGNRSLTTVRTFLVLNFAKFACLCQTYHYLSISLMYQWPVTCHVWQCSLQRNLIDEEVLWALLLFIVCIFVLCGLFFFIWERFLFFIFHRMDHFI